MNPRGPAPSDRYEAPALRDGIVDAADWIDAWARAASLPQDTVFAMRLCVEEAVTNVVLYAYEGCEPRGGFNLEAWLEGPEVRVRLTDAGAPFDVSLAHDPGPETDIASAAVGGRGIRLMRGFSQGLTYERKGGSNLLTLVFLKDGRPEGR